MSAAQAAARAAGEDPKSLTPEDRAVLLAAGRALIAAAVQDDGPVLRQHVERMAAVTVAGGFAAAAALQVPGLAGAALITTAQMLALVENAPQTGVREDRQDEQ